MKVVENLHKAANALAQQAQRGMDTAKLEMKIRVFRKEINELYSKIGKLIYISKSKNKPVSSEELDRLCKEIDTYTNKIKGFEKQIIVIKKDIEAKNDNDDSYPTTYSKLNKTEHDLKIMRTEEGIKFLKFCPECQIGNEPDTNECDNCGHKFS